MSYIENIIAYLGCECEIIKNAENASGAMKIYEELLALGKKEGFTPLIIEPSDLLCEVIEYAFPDYEKDDRISAIIESSYSINAVELLSNCIKEAMPIGEDSDYDIMGEFTDCKPVTLFHYLSKKIIIAKIPTSNPWELAAWIPMGGWNECPSPEEQVAVFKYWHEKYGAIPAVVCGDIWEVYVERPPVTNDEAATLAMEQFGFCADIVCQGVEKINLLASTLVDSKVWYFWWD